jgi:hypothetical protein
MTHHTLDMKAKSSKVYTNLIGGNSCPAWEGCGFLKIGNQRSNRISDASYWLSLGF